jgi:hypothetical protein
MSTLVTIPGLATHSRDQLPSVRRMDVPEGFETERSEVLDVKSG